MQSIIRGISGLKEISVFKKTNYQVTYKGCREMNNPCSPIKKYSICLQIRFHFVPSNPENPYL